MMRINETELLLTLEASLTGLLPLPDRLSPRSFDQPPPAPAGLYRHGQQLGWRELVEVTRIPGFGQDWVLVPLSGGQVVLAWAGAVAEIHLVAARRWQETALPVLVSLSSDPDGGLHG